MSEDVLQMNTKERQRKAILASVKEGYLTLGEAAKRMKICIRQARRILRRYEQEGDKGLIHKQRGKPSNHVCDEKFKTTVLEVYQSTYMGFGPTFAAEKLTESGYPTHPETLRLWLKGAGLWEKKRIRSTHRKHRQRKYQFGEMLQLDGSFHQWFGNEFRRDCLMNLVDDATGITLAFLSEEETTEAAMMLLKNWVERYGIPKSIYVDLKTVYVPHITLKPHDGLNELPAAFTHFSKACDKLGIEIIKAYSPQAKGRVERKHGVFQDRFVKELKLRNIKTREEANLLLEGYFLKQINMKFAKPAFNPTDGHRKTELYGDLEQIFCWDYERTIQNDWTIRFRAQHFQILKGPLVKTKPKQKIMVRVHLNGAISLWRGESRLRHEVIASSLEEKKKPAPKLPKGYDSATYRKNALKAKNNSPWRRGYCPSLFEKTLLDKKRPCPV